MSENYKPILPFGLEDKVAICLYPNDKRIKGHVEFVDDTGQVFIELENGERLSLTAEQVRTAQVLQRQVILTTTKPI